MTKYNYFDQNGNYINVENLSLADIYMRGASRAAIGSATLKVVREFKEALPEATSAYAVQQLKLAAFEKILEQYGGCPEFESEDAREAMRDVLVAKPLTEEEKKKFSKMWCRVSVRADMRSDAEEAAEDAIKEAHCLDDDEDSIAGRWHL